MELRSPDAPAPAPSERKPTSLKHRRTKLASNPNQLSACERQARPKAAARFMRFLVDWAPSARGALRFKRGKRSSFSSSVAADRVLHRFDAYATELHRLLLGDDTAADSARCVATSLVHQTFDLLIAVLDDVGAGLVASFLQLTRYADNSANAVRACLMNHGNSHMLLADPDKYGRCAFSVKNPSRTLVSAVGHEKCAPDIRNDNPTTPRARLHLSPCASVPSTPRKNCLTVKSSSGGQHNVETTAISRDASNDLRLRIVDISGGGGQPVLPSLESEASAMGTLVSARERRNTAEAVFEIGNGEKGS